MKKNCWEVKGCERCTGVLGEDSCPVCKEKKLHGVNGGANAGRACWAIDHTRCNGTTQGTFAKKFANCRECDFYKMVKAEERGSFELSAVILNKLEK